MKWTMEAEENADTHSDGASSSEEEDTTQSDDENEPGSDSSENSKEESTDRDSSDEGKIKAHRIIIYWIVIDANRQS